MDEEDSFEEFAVFANADDAVFTRKKSESSCSDWSDITVKTDVKPTELENNELNMEDDEDFNLVTVEEVSMEVLVKRMRRVLREILLRPIETIGGLFEVAVKIVYRSTMFEESSISNPVISTIIQGITMIILNTEERDERASNAEKNILLFTAKLAVICKSQKCEGLLESLFRLVQKYFYHPISEIRGRMCNIIKVLMVESSNIQEIEQEDADSTFLFSDEIVADKQKIIPIGIEDQWISKLTNSLLDKSPYVRAAAISSLAQFDHDKTIKTVSGEETTLNKLISKSMLDVDETVRKVAVKNIQIIDSNDIDKCLNFIEKSRENKIRHLLVVRLATNVHLLSFSEKQRFRLVNILLESESARMQDVIHQHLVDSWMKVTCETANSLSLFKKNRDEEQEEVELSQTEAAESFLRHFPSTILEYLNPMEDPNAVSILLKFAITRYIRLSTCKNTNAVDLEAFFKNLAQIETEKCEELGLMMRTNFRMLPEMEQDGDDDTETWIKKTYFRIFFLRHLLDSIFQLTNDKSSQSTNFRYRTLQFLIVGVVPISKHIQAFCGAYFENKEIIDEFGEDLEVILDNIFHMLSVIIKENDDTFEIKVFKDLLSTLLEKSSMKFSAEMVKIMCTHLMDLCGDNLESIQETKDWICYTANSVLISDEDGNPIGDDLKELLEKGMVLSYMLRRCTSMVLAVCQHYKVKEGSTLMTTLFRSLIPALLSNREQEIRLEGVELIGFSAVIDFENSSPYLKLTEVLLTSTDDNNLKASIINAMIRVIKFHSFESVAKLLYSAEEDTEKECHEHLANLFESEFSKITGLPAIQVVRDLLSLLSHVKIFWPGVISLILRRVFCKTERTPKLVHFFKKFCRKSVKSMFSRIHLMRGYLECINQCGSDSETRANCNISEMTEVISEQLSSILTLDTENKSEQEHTKTLDSNDNEFFIEAELCRRILEKTIDEPYSWMVRHLFNSLSTSLTLEFISFEQLVAIRDQVKTAMELVQKDGVRVSHLAVKRFLNYCEKAVNIRKKLNKIRNEEDLSERVKLEECDEVSEVGERSRKRKRKSNELTTKKSRRNDNEDDWEDIKSEGSDDSFVYIPKSTKTRGKRKQNGPECSLKRKKSILDEDDVKKECEEIEKIFIES